MIGKQKAAAGSRILKPVIGVTITRHFIPLERNIRGNLLFTMIDLPSVKLMTQRGNVGGQCET